MNVKKVICYISIFCVLLVNVFISIPDSVRANKLGRLCDELRVKLDNAEDTNRRLTETIGNCQSICDELGSSVDRSISTARDAIETIEQLRVQVQELESCLYGNSADYDYKYWDSYFGID